MKYRINLHFVASISKVVDISDEDDIIDEKNKFFNEYSVDEARECLTYDDWDYVKED